jgi:hypothetical protein
MRPPRMEVALWPPTGCCAKSTLCSKFWKNPVIGSKNKTTDHHCKPLRVASRILSVSVKVQCVHTPALIFRWQNSESSFRYSRLIISNPAPGWKAQAHMWCVFLLKTSMVSTSLRYFEVETHHGPATNFRLVTLSSRQLVTTYAPWAALTISCEP